MLWRLHNIFLDRLFQTGAQPSYFRADLDQILINEHLKKLLRANFLKKYRMSTIRENCQMLEK